MTTKYRPDKRVMRTFDLVMPKTKIPRSEFEHRVEIEGLKEFQRALRYADNDTKKMVKQGSKAIADHVVKVMRVRAMRIRHREQYALVAPSIRAVQGTTPRIRFGGKKRAKVSPKYASGKRRTQKVYAGELIYGVEFGGGKAKRTPVPTFRNGRRYYGSTKQFPTHKGQKGYVIFPAIRESHGYIKREYTKQIEKALKRLGN
jgi:hypothetical protein